MKNPIEKLADKAYSIYQDGGKLTMPEAEYFRNCIRMLDFASCERILQTVSQRNTLRKG